MNKASPAKWMAGLENYGRFP